MTSMTATTHDDTITHDDTTTLDHLGDLSRRHARHGDLRLAQLAAWASDVHLLEALLWENGLGDAPDPDAQLAAVGDAVAASLEARAEAVTEGLTARQVVELAREALLATFDESVHALVTERFLSLDHLDATRDAFHAGPSDAHPSEGAATAEDGSSEGQSQDRFDEGAEPAFDVVAGVVEDVVDEIEVGAQRDLEASALQRLQGRTPEHLVAELRATAADCMVVAEMMAAEGDEAGAVRLARQADAAAFEAYLTTAAARAGDHRLATVDLRWALARRLDLPGADSGDLVEAVAACRSRLGSLLGSAEQGTLRETFEPLLDV